MWETILIASLAGTFIFTVATYLRVRRRREPHNHMTDQSEGERARFVPVFHQHNLRRGQRFRSW